MLCLLWVRPCDETKLLVAAVTVFRQEDAGPALQMMNCIAAPAWRLDVGARLE
jgi:hypothetical protein